MACNRYDSKKVLIICVNKAGKEGVKYRFCIVWMMKNHTQEGVG